MEGERRGRAVVSGRRVVAAGRRWPARCRVARAEAKTRGYVRGSPSKGSSKKRITEVEWISRFLLRFLYTEAWLCLCCWWQIQYKPTNLN